jgi:hypothetical protein
LKDERHAIENIPVALKLYRDDFRNPRASHFVVFFKEI